MCDDVEVVVCVMFCVFIGDVSVFFLVLIVVKLLGDRDVVMLFDV